jgi:GTP cyclohydrolase II
MAERVERHPSAHRTVPVDRAIGDALAVDLAVVALCAGAPVVVQERDGRELLVQVLDGLGPTQLAHFRALAAHQHRIVLSHRRLAATTGSDGGLVTVLAPERADAAELRALARPPLDRAAEQVMFADPCVLSPEGCEAAAVALAKLAGLLPAVLVASARWPAGARPSAVQGMPILTVSAEAVLRHPEVSGCALRAVGGARVPLALAGDTRLVVFRSPGAFIDHVAILVGEPERDRAPLVRMHSACFTGDILGSMRCDCGEQLHGALEKFADIGSGILLYLAQEGRGIGLLNKMRAYELQDRGLDTVDANEELGFAPDERVYHPAAAMLRELGITRVRLLTNNPDKVSGLANCGITVVERVSHWFPANTHNARYLRTKALRSGHALPLDGNGPLAPVTAEGSSNAGGIPAAPATEGQEGR